MGLLEWWYGPKPQGKPSPSPQKAPPPPTKPGASIRAPTNQCPPAPAPCDVDKLVVEVLAREDNMTEDKDAKGKKLQPGEKKDVLRKLETTKVRRGEVVKDVKDKETLSLLRAYDLLIEGIAEYHAREGQKGSREKGPDADDQVTIQVARAYFHGRSCSVHQHAQLELKAVSPKVPELPAPLVKRQPGAGELVHKDKGFYAESLPWDDFPMGEGYFALFEMIRTLLSTTQPKDIAIIASSCGVRPRAEGKPANKALTALVRIYRRDKWTVGVKIPPLGAFKDERQGESWGSLWGKPPSSGNFKRTRSGSVGGQMGIGGESSIERDGRKLTQSEQVSAFGMGGRATVAKEGKVKTTTYQTTENSGTAARPVYGETVTKKKGKKAMREEVDERLELASGFEIILARNDREVKLAELISKGKEYKKGAQDLIAWLKRSISNLAKAITDVKEFFKKVPQFGWKFTFEINVFAGTLSLEWGPSYAKGPALANGRYYPIEYTFKGKISMEVFNLSIALSFGLDAKALDTGLVLKIEGTIKLKVVLEHDINMDLLKPKERFDLNASANAKIAAIGYASVVGKTVADAELSVSSGLEFKGYMEIEWSSKTFGIKGILKRKAITVSGYIKVPYWWDKKISPPIVLLEGGEVYTFK